MILFVFVVVALSASTRAEESFVFENASNPFQLEPKAFTSHTENESPISNHRSKRFITFNVQAPFFVGLLLSIPITLILPSMSSIFNGRKKKRSVAEGIDFGSYQDSPFIQPNLEKMNNYFELLQITEPSCQERAVCEMSAAPSKYFPISELLLKQISLPNRYTIYQEEDDLSIHQNNTRSKRSLFSIYTRSADHGMEKGESACHKKFETDCPYNLEDRLNMPVLRFWQALASILKLTFTDSS